MTSWRTSIGGALGALGTFLWGAPMACKAMDVILDPTTTKWCVIVGLIASAAGVFAVGLFGRDNQVTSEQVKADKDKTGKVMSWVAFALGSALFLSACSWSGKFKVAEGSDPVVVRAEQVAKNAYQSMDMFVGWEYRNRAILGKDVKAQADLVREFGPIYLERLDDAIVAYKGTKTAEDREILEKALAKLEELLNDARGYYLKKGAPK